MTRKASPRSLTTTNRGLSTSSQEHGSDEDLRLLRDHNSENLTIIRTRGTHQTPEDHSNITSSAPHQYRSLVHRGPCSVHIARSGSISMTTTETPPPPHQGHNSNGRKLLVHRDSRPINITSSRPNRLTPETPHAVALPPPYQERNFHGDRQLLQGENKTHSDTHRYTPGNTPTAPPPPHFQELGFNRHRQLQVHDNTHPQIIPTVTGTPPASYHEYVPLLIDNDSRRTNTTPLAIAGHTTGVRRTRTPSLYQHHQSDEVRIVPHPESEEEEVRFGPNREYDTNIPNPIDDAPPPYEEIFGSTTSMNNSN